MLGQVRLRIRSAGKPTQAEVERLVKSGAGDLLIWRGEKPKNPERLKLGKAGIVKQRAAPNLALIDCDHDSPVDTDTVFRLAGTLGCRVMWIRYDRTARGWHVIVKFNRKFPRLALVAIQAILGSDTQREKLNLARVLSGKRCGNRWNFLFEEKLE